MYTIGGPDYARTVVVDELPECHHGYERAGREASYQAALNVVGGLIEWRLALHQEYPDGSRWPVGDYGGADLIHGDLYRWIKELGDFRHCRTVNVIEFLHAAVPDLHQEWEQQGLTLVPIYLVHSERRSFRRSITLRLVPKTDSN